MSGNEGFFRIDQRTWARVCELGMNPAVSYLVLAAGTGKDNRTTAWSSHAISEYSGIAWGRAARAIKALCDAKFVAQTSGGSRPRYELLDWSELEQVAISYYAQTVLNDVTRGQQPKRKSFEQRTADELVQSGRLWLCEDRYVAQPPGDSTVGQFIWLPQTLVTGTSKGEPSPLERVRRTRDVMTLRLFIDLYSAHHLQDDGGISRNVVWQEFHRERVFECGVYIVWSFRRSGTDWASPHPVTNPHWEKGEDGQRLIWKRLATLRDLGLIEFFTYLCEDNTPDGEPIHPYGTDWSEAGLSLEDKVRRLENSIGLEAQRAAERIVGPRHLYGGFLVPISRDLPDVHMVGIARLRYRPHTKRTKRWMEKLLASAPAWIDHYQALERAGKKVSPSMHINDVNEVNEDQGLSTGFND